MSGPLPAAGSSLLGAALVAAAAVAFSGKAVIIKVAYQYGVDAVTLLALRMAFSAPLFLALALWAGRAKGAPRISRGEALRIAALGMIGYYLASLFDFLGLQHITAALERLVLFLYPTIVVLLSALLFGRRVGRTDVAALVLSYAGIALVVANDFATQPGEVALGAFWVLLSAICYALYLIGSGRFVERLGSVRFACLAGLASCAGVMAHFLALREPSLLWRQPGEVHALAALMAAVSTVLPIIFMSEGIRRMGSSRAAMVSSVGPVATIVLGFWFLDEPITAIQLAGAALVLSGVLAISLGRPVK
jgi:drug/metabolite transporter (DMT)-like permease